MSEQSGLAVQEESAAESGAAERFSGRDMFALYPELKDAHDGPGAFAAENEAVELRLRTWMEQRKPGCDLRAQQLTAGAWTLMRSVAPGSGLLAWTRIQVRTPEELGVEAYHDSPEAMTRTVKAAARFYGAGAVGVAPMRTAYVNQKSEGRAIVFEDVAVPQVSETRLVIPRRMQWVIVLAVPMDPALLLDAPAILGEAATSLGYSHSVLLAASLAEFIRGLGYQAIPSINDTAQSVPFAIDAGLGELSRMNKLVTPQFGAAVRLCKVFTDMPLASDKPVRFGVEERCRKCRRCAAACPAHALSFDAEPSFQTRGPWNHPGHRAWFEDSYKCFSYWREAGNGCAVCLASCPFTRDGYARDAVAAHDADPDEWWNRAAAEPWTKTV